MSENPQLPESTPPPPRTDAPTDSDLIGIPEALQLYDLGDSTLRRKLREGKVEGARTVTTNRGEEWRFPADSLEALGYTRKGTGGGSAGSAGLERAVEDTLEALREQLDLMRDSLKREQLQLEAAKEDRANGAVEVARLQEQQKALEERLQDSQAAAEQRYREALELGWRQRRKRRKALESGE
jgi:hypothetical protein